MDHINEMLVNVNQGDFFLDDIENISNHLKTKTVPLDEEDDDDEMAIPVRSNDGNDFYGTVYGTEEIEWHVNEHMKQVDMKNDSNWVCITYIVEALEKVAPGTIEFPNVFDPSTVRATRYFWEDFYICPETAGTVEDYRNVMYALEDVADDLEDAINCRTESISVASSDVFEKGIQ